MRVAFLYNRSSEDPTKIAEDEFPARSPIVAALKRLGYKVLPIPCTLDLSAVRRRLVRARPDVVFNRVESLGGSDGMMAVVTLLLDTMQIPYTGCSTAALVATVSKVLAKERMLQAGLPTPAWLTRAGNNPKSEIRNPKFILKSIYEHASFELDDNSIVQVTNQKHLQQLLRKREAATGRAYFAEAFIEGREFNLSLIGATPDVLPPAEIDFSAFPTGKARIVGHVAKWIENSFEYQSTERLFEFPATDQPLIKRLTDLAIECWSLFDLCGYARVDFRVDACGQAWILEVNANPGIAPDAGFVAALERAGISYEAAIERIIDDAVVRQSRRPPHRAPAANYVQ